MNTFWQQVAGTVLGAVVSIATTFLVHYFSLKKDREQWKEQRALEDSKADREKERLREEWSRQQEAERRASLREVYANCLYSLALLVNEDNPTTRAEACKWLNRLLVDFPDAGDERRQSLANAIMYTAATGSGARRLFTEISDLSKADNRVRLPG